MTGKLLRPDHPDMRTVSHAVRVGGQFCLKRINRLDLIQIPGRLKRLKIIGHRTAHNFFDRLMKDIVTDEIIQYRGQNQDRKVKPKEGKSN